MLKSQLQSEALARGFALFGVAPAADADGFAHFADWLDRGYAGEMDYLHRHRAQRRHPNDVLESVRSVVMLGMEYQSGIGYRVSGIADDNSVNRLDAGSSPDTRHPIPDTRGRLASYAAGPDYHRFIWDRLNDLAAWLEGASPGCRTRAVADTAPLLERDFARRAGLGWVGKNTMLLNPRRGSFFFLGALLTDLELPPDPPFAGSHCGTCTACLDACPTGAFPTPFVLDASKCISYLTIELRGPIPVDLREGVGGWLYGCDVCQDVCPWNRMAKGGAFPHDPEMEYLDPIELLGLDADAYRERFKKTSLFRNRRAGLLRNAAVVLGNVGDERALAALEKTLTDPEDMVRDAAAWAITRIRQRTQG